MSNRCAARQTDRPNPRKRPLKRGSDDGDAACPTSQDCPGDGIFGHHSHPYVGMMGVPPVTRDDGRPARHARPSDVFPGGEGWRTSGGQTAIARPSAVAPAGETPTILVAPAGAWTPGTTFLPRSSCGHPARSDHCQPPPEGNAPPVVKRRTPDWSAKKYRLPGPSGPTVAVQVKVSPVIAKLYPSFSPEASSGPRSPAASRSLRQAA